MSYAHFLSKNNFSWRPAYVRNESNFRSQITSYRAKWRGASRANRPAIESNFKRNYNKWLVKVKMANTEKRKKNQELFNQIRQAKKAGNNATVARLVNSPPRATAQASPRRLSSPVRSGKKRNSKSLIKMMASNKLAEMKKNLRAQMNALESQRNNIERKINAVRREFRSLPV